MVGPVCQRVRKVFKSKELYFSPNKIRKIAYSLVSLENIRGSKRFVLPSSFQMLRFP